MDLGVQRNINLTHINRGGNSATIAQVTNRPVLNITR